MQIEHIPLDRLAVSKVNMRGNRKVPDVSDILPSIRQRGVLSPLFVRSSGTPDRYEIVAGKRRYHASLEAAKDAPTPPALPCIVIGQGDDAEALEVSMIENMLRENPDQVTQWESYTRLVREGRSVEDIAAMFALTELQVRRVLALGNLLPRIREAFRDEEIDAATVRHLTLATKAQQKAWLALYEGEDSYAPRGHQLKAWLFGGASISVRAALFDLAAYKGQVVSDLFDEDGYFGDSGTFWAAQLAEVEARKAAYIEQGWAGVEIIPPGQYFSSWQYAKAAKRKGGRVYIECRNNGEVAFHEGYLTQKEVQRIVRGEDGGTSEKPARPEITGPMQTYIDLHRHAAVRAAMTAQPRIALRVMVAHAIVGSPLWTVRPEPQTARGDAVRASLEASPAEAEFGEKRRAVLAVLGLSEDEPTVTGGNGDSYGLAGVLLRLLELPDGVVMDVLAVVMGETLASGSVAVELVGSELGVDMARYWQADTAFFELLRDREVLSRLVAEMAGETVTAANAGEKTKGLKTIVRDHLDGANGRAKVENWVPKWMRFPPAAYTARGGVGTVRAAALVAAAREEDARSEASLNDEVATLPQQGNDAGEPEPDRSAEVIAA